MYALISTILISISFQVKGRLTVETRLFILLDKAVNISAKLVPSHVFFGEVMIFKPGE